MELKDLERARDVLAGVVRLTPVVYSYTFSGLSHGDIYFKAECMQRAGSFKIRGAYNKVRSLPEGTREVLCVSAGNHAQGVALAASLAGLKATVVMPEDASLTKVERTRSYGAEVVLAGRTLEEAYDTARKLESERGLAFIHPYDDAAVIAGQGTLGLELIEQLADVSTVLVPVGGGGLISGVALAIKEKAPRVRVIGVQAEGAAAAARSYYRGTAVDVSHPETLADGIRVGRVGTLTLELMRRYVDDIVVVTDEEITEAMVQILDRSKLVVEGAGAAGAAAIVAEKVRPKGKVCAVLSGGNIDLNLMARVVERGLTRARRYTVVRLRIDDRPGALYAALGPLSALKTNVLDVKMHRAGYEVPVGMTEIDLLLETRDTAHVGEVVAALARSGFEPRLLHPAAGSLGS